MNSHNGGQGEIRTHEASADATDLQSAGFDLLHTYPYKWAMRGSNPRPCSYELPALTN